MTPERHRQIGKLYHSALKREPGQRSAFLARACNGDEQLLTEVQSLLASHEEAGSFIESPALDVAAEIVAADLRNDMVGQRLSHYEIKALLGAGGMGEVYLAQDEKLDRKIALKILPAEVAFDQDRMRRFVREAQAASALNHPNIITIHEIDRTDAGYLMATEFIDGQTLRQLLATGALKTGAVLNIAVQVAGALVAAHDAGIVHRDIKPENVMLRPDGIVKVLDFGLAKLTERSAESVSLLPGVFTNTDPGIVMGTVAYMSPEQALGMPVDSRTDIFSLGVVLFEMVAGCLPFAGSNSGSVLALILSDQKAPPLSQYSNEIPAELERIISKALCKNRDERYQTASELLADLKQLARQLELASPWEDGAEPAQAARAITETRRQPVPTTPVWATANGVAVAGGGTFAAAYLIKQIKHHGRIALAGLAIGVAILAYFTYFKQQRAPSLTQQDTILIADFDNLTGDADFDGTLKQSLVVLLEQSPFLKIFSNESVRETLHRRRRFEAMADSPVELLTPPLAKEICQHEGLRAMLTGSIGSLGTHYVLALQVTDAQTGDVLARARTEAESKERVLAALGMAATNLRAQLGESPSSIRKFDVPAEQAISPSLKALKYFSLAVGQVDPDSSGKTILFLERAIEFDPDFAMAYARLATHYDNVGQQGSDPYFADDAARKAFKLRDRVSERERLEISIRYYSLVTGEWDKVSETAQLWIRTYPDRWPQPYNELANSYNNSGQYEKAIEAANQSLRLPPVFAAKYLNLGRALMSLNRFAEAKSVFEQTGVRGRRGYAALYMLAFVNGDTATMEQQLNKMPGTRDEHEALEWQAETAAFAGQQHLAQELSRRAATLATSKDAKELAAQYSSLQFLRAATFGQCRLAAKTAQTLALDQSSKSLTSVTLGLALCGEDTAAQRLIKVMQQRYPRNTLLNNVSLPTIEAAIAIKSNHPALAIQVLETSKRYQAAAEFWPQYLRGQAYLKLKRGAEAAVEFQQIVDHRGQCPLSPLYPLAHLGLARASALTDDPSQSRKAYRDFFALWKNADDNLAVLIEAKKDYEKLH